MRTLKFKLVKNNQLQGIAELQPNGIISAPYEWDTAYQFTGLLDKQGKEIYEGDILRCLESDGELQIELVIWNDNHGCWGLQDWEYTLYDIPFSAFEVIGISMRIQNY
jgi:hypothetical protein